MATGPIATFTGIVGGSGYKNGVFRNVALSGGAGSGASAHITVSGNAVTSLTLPHPTTAAQLDRVGKNYQISDSLSADPGFDGVGSGSGFMVNVGTLAKACENCFYGKIVPPSAGPNLFGQRYCSNAAYVNQNDKVFALQLLAGRAPFQNDASAITSHSWEALICQDDYFCGEGADLVSGVSFSSVVNSLPPTSGVIRSKAVSLGSVNLGVTTPITVTGIGFKPSAIILIGTNASAARVFSIGFSDQSATPGGQFNLSGEGSSATSILDLSTNNCLTFQTSIGNDCFIAVTAIGNDGFTLSRTLQGSPTGAANVAALCFA